MSYFKIRASYGLTGSQNLSYYDFASYYGAGVYNGNPAIKPKTLGNNSLQWESQSQTDIGIDFGMFDDKVRGTLGWYRKYVDNLITGSPVPTSSSFFDTTQNIGAISNTGIEFDVTMDIIRSKELTWEITLNAAHNKGKLERINGVAKFLGGGSFDTYKLEEGGELGQFYGYLDAGRFIMNGEELWAMKPINPSNGKPTYYRTSSYEGIGDIYVVDLDGDGKITKDDRKNLGSAMPDVYGGFGSTLYWKGLRANLTFAYSIGGKRYWQQEAKTFGGINNYNAPTIALKSWTMERKSGKYPVITHSGYGSNNVFTNRWLHNASFMRLSSLNISYRLPDSWFSQTVVKGIEANFQATNLFTLTKYPGMDPQGNFDAASALYGYGTDYSTYPSARSFNFGLRFTLK